MNPWDLSASDLLIWGLVLHLIADWPLQNDWMANNKANMWHHPAGCVHAGIHGCLLALVFGWAAMPLATSHLLIDTRKPVVWWSKLIGQTEPKHPIWARSRGIDSGWDVAGTGRGAPLMDVGMEVRFWVDQVFHIICIAIAALLVA